MIDKPLTEKIQFRTTKGDKEQLCQAGKNFGLRVSDLVRLIVKRGLRQIKRHGGIELDRRN